MGIDERLVVAGWRLLVEELAALLDSRQHVWISVGHGHEEPCAIAGVVPGVAGRWLEDAVDVSCPTNLAETRIPGPNLTGGDLVAVQRILAVGLAPGRHFHECPVVLQFDEAAIVAG